jgi:hypothetical protein
MVGVKPKKPRITMKKCFQVLFRQKVKMPACEAIKGIKNQPERLIPLEAGSLSEKLVLKTTSNTIQLFPGKAQGISLKHFPKYMGAQAPALFLSFLLEEFYSAKPLNL